MNKLLSTVPYIIFIAIFGVSSAARACSMGSNYYQPTNFDLVQLVDAIVVATPQSQKEVGDYDYEVMFRIDRVFKGDVGPVFINDYGWIQANLGETFSSNPDDLQYAHPESYGGPCIRQTFEKGRPYVLFLSKSEDGTYYRPLFAWARVAEDYYGEDSLWVTTIRYYLEVQKEPDPIKQLEILKKKYQALIAQKEISDYEAELAEDIFFHLSKVSAYKPTEYLLEEFRSLDDGRSNVFAITERTDKIDAYLTRKQQRQAAKIKAERAAAGLPEEEDDPFGWDDEDPAVHDPDDARIRVLEALTEGEHPDAMPIFDELLQKEGQKVRFLSIVAQYYAQNGRYHDALQLLRDRAFIILNTADLGDAYEFYRTTLIIKTDPDDWDKDIWLDDKQVREWWPEFAYSMYSTLVSRYEKDHIRSAPSPDTIETELKELRPKDYRKRPDISALLATFYQDPVIDWAKKELEAHISYHNSFDDTVRSGILGLPARVFLEGHSYELNYVVDLQRFFCSSKVVRAALLEQLGSVRGIKGMDYVYYFTEYKLYDPDEKQLLIKSLISLSAREEWFNQNWVVSYIQGKPLKIETLFTQGETLENIRSEIVLVELGDYLRSHRFQDEEGGAVKPLNCSAKP